MSANFGVNVRTTVNAARPMKIESSTPIGVVATSKAEPGLYFYGNTTEARKTIDDMADQSGSLKAAVIDIDDQNVSGPLIVSSVLEGADDAATQSNVIAGIEKLKMAQGELAYAPNLIVAPEFSDIQTVAAKMQLVAEKLRATAIIDLNKDNESDAVAAVSSFGSKRVLLCDPYVKVGDDIFRPMSARIAGMIAKTDAEWEYGFADSFSNRIMNGIVGTKRVVEFVPGENCEADRLRDENITSVIRYKGYRAWGGETTDGDPIWKSLTRVRIFDRICGAALDGLFWAIDKRADVLKAAKDSVDQMLLGLQGSGVLLGFNVFWDPEQNTAVNVTAGKFYMIAEMQDMPIVKRLEVNFSYVDRYGDVLIKEIS
ncbi:MAG: phage tail protein [Desulfobacterales bacterium]|nr:phage tail protein [Desulfobacterales bacterium]